MAKKAKKKVLKKGRPEGSALRGFVFTGDPRTEGSDPASISMSGYVFKLDGKSVKVSNEAAVRFAKNTHFTEK